MKGDKQQAAKAPAFPFPTTRPGPDGPGKPEAAAPETGQPEELSAEELRLMADTMPGDGPGDD
jgi:hypothetical protein